MHWTFYIFALCALAGWSLGAMVRAVTKPPAWLFET